MNRDIIKKIEILNDQLRSLGKIDTQQQQKLDKKFRLEFNYNTNHLEGNTLTYSETEVLLIFDDSPKETHTMRELEEMKGSDLAFQFIKEWATDKEHPLSEQCIKSLNAILLVRPFWKNAITSDNQPTRRKIIVGEYKQYPNSVRLPNGELFDYASPVDTPILMGELIEWYRVEEAKKELHPVHLAALLHYKFVRIHPFDDGNGRISRLLMNYVLLKNDLPLIVVKSEDKRNYLQSLNRADAGDLDVFCDYIANQLIWSLELSIKAVKGESLNEPGDLDKKIQLLKQKLNIEKSVKITKSKASILEVLNRDIEPLFRQISAKLSEFDIFFKSKAEGLKSGSTSWGNNLDASINALKVYLTTREFSSSLKYTYQLNHLRHNPSINIECNLTIMFYMNVYDVYSDFITVKYSKLYDESLINNEINNIIEQLGTHVYELIEDKLKGTSKLN